MKNLKLILAIFVATGMLFSSCSKDEANEPSGNEEMGSISIGAILNDLVDNNRQAISDEIPVCSDDTPMYAWVVLTHELGTEDVVVPILFDGETYFTDYEDDLEIPIPANETTTAVSLTTFMVYAEEPGEGVSPIWVAPTDEGEYKNFVNDALPINFDLRAGSKKYLDVEVLCFDDRDVNLYGYQFFDLIPIELYEFCVFANYCTDNGRHYTANYNLDIDYIREGEEDINLYTNKSPETGNTEDDNSGDWYAEPLCLAIPAPMYDELDTDVYLRVTVTLADWDDNYGTPGAEEPEVIYLSWNDVQSYFGDNDTIDYEHIFFNCGDDPIQDCPITEEDTDGDCVPDNEDECPGYDDRDDMDGDGVPDGCDSCPEDFGDPLDGGCPIDECAGDADGDGLNDCIDECPYQAGPESNNGCPEEEGDYCETAYMKGDTGLNTLANANRWGWAEHYQTSEDGDSKTFSIWAGAGQNDTSKGELVGTAEISIDDDDITLEITLEPGVSLNELHINLSEEVPSGNNVFAPGQYNLNDEVNAGTLTYTWERDYSDDFYIIVHAVACY
ncbi:thrombospondin type 3 repeat-containing protein [Salegentibacter sp. LM13S]|uniref:thrombospondin type 3 repeat-containing protein n=1 Tax=Salegentibacter lacus TaxID=2873599 RepID=UPI001CC9BEC5|nr:thrombospondin type 3 repeat-containing protein [Salegentibacter lacus]MBZ9631534.1 thrombospondin type 3 repeat-containing protein [Salegentibacter lacus]